MKIHLTFPSPWEEADYVQNVIFGWTLNLTQGANSPSAMWLIQKELSNFHVL